MPGTAQQTGPRNCFWQVQSDPVLINVGYPDFAAIYWLSMFALPAGAELEIKGQYPHARYMSFNVYDAGAAPVDGLADALIAPDAGSTNPFLAGARRDAPDRSYTVRVKSAAPPEPREPNTLYQVVDGTVSLAPVTGGKTASPVGMMLYRIYLPDDGRDISGDVPLPAMAVVLANGQRIEGPAACDVLSQSVPDPVTSILLGATPPTSPSATRGVTDPVTWSKFTSITEGAGVPKPEQVEPFVPNSGGYFSNTDNAYVSAAWDTSYGDGVMLFGRAPIVPRTRAAPPVMPEGQMRYWSICQNDAPKMTTRAVSCAADEDVPLTLDGNYIMFISGAGTRPANATPECGVAWLPSGPNLSGLLIVRNMLPRPDFARSIQAVTDRTAPGMTMGPYLPIGKHLTRAQFESLGCPVATRAVVDLLKSSGVDVGSLDVSADPAPARALGGGGSLDRALLLVIGFCLAAGMARRKATALPDGRSEILHASAVLAFVRRPSGMGMFLLMICGAISGCSSERSDSLQGKQEGATPTPIVEQRIQPADTCPGITEEVDEGAYHHVALPADAAQRKDVLVLYMVGSLGTPEYSLEISQFAAGLGYGVLNIRYPNTTVVGVVCLGRDDCYGQYRGETIFGENVAYSAGSPTYDEASNVVSLENSVVSRAACLLDYLAHQAPSEANPQPTYWRQFLREAPQSPYATPNLGKAYPAWSKIIVAGHSQGGGMAPMLAMNIAPDDPARRVVMFSAPNDNANDAVEERSASWIQKASATPLDRYWGIRHPDDTTTGAYIQLNWSNLGGTGSGGIGGPGNGEEVDIGDGSGDPAGRQRLVLTVPVASSGNAHSSTVNQELAPEVVHAWTYLFTAGGTD